MPAGDPRRSLIETLGIKAGVRICVLGAPSGYAAILGELPDRVNWQMRFPGPLDFIHFWCKERKDQESRFAALQKALVADGAFWISWPKGSSKVWTDLNENVIREIGLKNGLVDVKVCTVDETWSGLKFVFRVRDRGKPPAISGRQH